jgi:hypothetical protein
MQPVKLAWSWMYEEGRVYLSSDFKQADPVLQIDALNDWICELDKIRSTLLEQENPIIREQLWGQ